MTGNSSRYRIAAGFGLVFVLLMSGFSNTSSFGISAASAVIDQTTLEPVKLQRSTNSVYSMQPILVYVYYKAGSEGGKHDIKLKVTVLIDAKAEQPGILQLPLVSPINTELAMVPLATNAGWYMAGIPGLPSQTVTVTIQDNNPINQPFPQPTASSEKTNVILTSKVSYSLVVDGVEKASDVYTVLEGSAATDGKNHSPFVYSIVYDVINDNSIIDETLGLGPKGWVWPAQSDMKVLVVAADDKDIDKLSFEYSKDGSNNWQHAPTQADATLMKNADDLTKLIDDNLGKLRNAIHSSGNELVETKPALLIASATIPSQPSGSYVKFRANATDSDGNKSTSPSGLYYTVNKSNGNSAGDKILIVDPHVLLWLYQTNSMQSTEMARHNVDFNVPSDIDNTAKIAKALEQNAVESFHHWEYLGKDHDLYIAYPKSTIVSDQLKSGNTWDAIILSNLWLGIDNDKSQTFNWDLDRLGVLDDISSYVRTNHAGLVVTHGTLSDWQVWNGCSDSQGDRQQVGSRGNIGSSISDLNMKNEPTVAALLGMPQLTIAEAVRDETASAVCSQNSDIGKAIGSMPLQIPYVKFDGKLKLTDEAKDIGWNISVQQFSIESANSQQPRTEIGWQIAMPENIAHAAWQKLKIEGLTNSSTPNIASLANSVSGDNTQETALKTGVNSSLDWGFDGIYTSVHSLDSNSTATSGVTVQVTPLNNDVSVPLDGLDRAGYQQFLNLKPTKLVALSDDGLAGIVAHDKYWDKEGGHRSVYFSFEPESSANSQDLLADALDWSYKWQYREVSGDGLINKEHDLLTQLGMNPPSFAGIQPVINIARWQNMTIPVKIASNSTTINEFQFDQSLKKISFRLEGPSGTTGISRIDIPKQLMNGNFTLLLDGKVHQFLQSVNATHTSLFFTYGHSSHKVEVLATQAIPEFSSTIMLSTVLTIFILGSIMSTRHIRKNY